MGRWDTVQFGMLCSRGYLGVEWKLDGAGHPRESIRCALLGPGPRASCLSASGSASRQVAAAGCPSLGSRTTFTWSVSCACLSSPPTALSDNSLVSSTAQFGEVGRKLFSSLENVPFWCLILVSVPPRSPFTSHADSLSPSSPPWGAWGCIFQPCWSVSSFFPATPLTGSPPPLLSLLLSPNHSFSLSLPRSLLRPSDSSF